MREKEESRGSVTQYRLDGSLEEVLARFMELVREPGAQVVMFGKQHDWKAVVEVPVTNAGLSPR